MKTIERLFILAMIICLCSCGVNHISFRRAGVSFSCCGDSIALEYTDNNDNLKEWSVYDTVYNELFGSVNLTHYIDKRRPLETEKLHKCKFTRVSGTEPYYIYYWQYVNVNGEEYSIHDFILDNEEELPKIGFTFEQVLDSVYSQEPDLIYRIDDNEPHVMLSNVCMEGKRISPSIVIDIK